MSEQSLARKYSSTSWRITDYSTLDTWTKFRPDEPEYESTVEPLSTSVSEYSKYNVKILRRFD
jgi:hypothetical protein